MIQNFSNKDGLFVYYTDDKASLKISEFLKLFHKNNCILLCIGTDRFIGDCLGPLTGTLLSKLGLAAPVFGTLESPVHAVNLKRTLSYIKKNYENHSIIAIDACLGTSQSVGYIQVKEGSIQPGRGVGRSLPQVGDYSIIGVVDKAVEDDEYEYENYLRISNVRLGMVMRMSETITKGIYSAFKNK